MSSESAGGSEIHTLQGHMRLTNLHKIPNASVASAQISHQIKQKLEKTLVKPVKTIEKIFLDKYPESKWDSFLETLKFPPLYNLSNSIIQYKRLDEDEKNKFFLNSIQ